VRENSRRKQVAIIGAGIAGLAAAWRLSLVHDATIQVIALRQSDFASHRRQPDFIQRYIFPDGMLPANEIVSQLGLKAELRRLDTSLFGSSHARTLRLWFEAFGGAWGEIDPS
jgi:cyclopropane-fatty-acyl-phospholipid synthase